MENPGYGLTNKTMDQNDYLYPKPRKDPDSCLSPTTQMIPVYSSSRTIVRSQYPSQSSVVLGGILVVCGVLAIILNGAGFAADVSASVFAHGFSSGLIAIINGALAIAAGKKKTKCLIIANMVLSIISFIFALYLIAWSCFSHLIDYILYLDMGDCIINNGDPVLCNHREIVRKAQVAINTLMIILGMIIAVVAVWSAAITFRYECCRCCKLCCCTCYRNDEVDNDKMSVVYVQNTSVIVPVVEKA